MFLSFVKGVIKGANFQIPAVSCWVVYVSGENLPAIYWEQNSGGSIHQAVNCTCGKCMAIRNTVLAKLFKPSHEKSTYKLCYRRYHCEILWILQTWIKRWIIHTYFIIFPSWEILSILHHQNTGDTTVWFCHWIQPRSVIFADHFWRFLYLGNFPKTSTHHLGWPTAGLLVTIIYLDLYANFKPHSIDVIDIYIYTNKYISIHLVDLHDN